MKKQLMVKLITAALSMSMAAMSLTGCGWKKQEAAKEKAGYGELGREITREIKQQKKEIPKAETCYVCLDVNPSVELVIGQGNKVLQVNAANQDAKDLLKDMDLRGKNIEDAVEDILKALKNQGYLNMDTANEILVSVEDNAIAPEVLEGVNQGIKTVVEAQTVKVNLMEQKITVTQADIEAAKNYEISVGKYHFIQQLLAGRDDITIEEMAQISIKDLAAYAIQNNMDVSRVMEIYQEAAEEAVEDSLEGNNDMDDADDDADDVNDNMDDVNDDADDINDDADDINDDADDVNDDADDDRDDANDDMDDGDNDADDVNDDSDDQDDNNGQKPDAEKVSPANDNNDGSNEDDMDDEDDDNSDED